MNNHDFLMVLPWMMPAAEAILFSAGDAVAADKLAEALEIDAGTLIDVIRSLGEGLAGRGVKLIEVDGAYQMCSRSEYYEYIRKALEQARPRRLSQAALETLSIIAYNQPVTRSGIEFVRGVDSSYSVNKLVGRGLIEEAGRLDAPGRPVLYVTTPDFLRCFGLTSLEDLPELQKESE